MTVQWDSRPSDAPPPLVASPGGPNWGSVGAELALERSAGGHGERMAIGLLYRNPEAPRYDIQSKVGLGKSREEKLAAIERELDRFVI